MSSFCYLDTQSVRFGCKVPLVYQLDKAIEEISVVVLDCIAMRTGLPINHSV